MTFEAQTALSACPVRQHRTSSPSRYQHTSRKPVPSTMSFPAPKCARARACPLVQQAMKQGFLSKYAKCRRVRRACQLSGVTWHHVNAWLRWDTTFRRRFRATQRRVRRELPVLRSYLKAAHSLAHQNPHPNARVLSIRMPDGSTAALQGGRLVIRLAPNAREPRRDRDGRKANRHGLADRPGVTGARKGQPP